MYIARVHLSNIKGFTEKREVDLVLPAHGSWTVLAGRNGSGKTTLLQAIALAVSGPSVTRTLVSDFGGWLSSQARNGLAEASVVRDSSADRITGRRPAPAGEGGEPPVTLGLGWNRPAVGSRISPLRPRLEAYHVEADGLNPERGPWAENPSGWFCAGYGPFRRLIGGSSEAQRLMFTPGPVGRMATLFHEDASLAEGVTWLIDLHLRRLEKRTGAAKTLNTVLKLLSDGLLPDGYRVTRVNADGLWVRNADSRRAYPLREMSDGYRTVAALILDIARQIQAAYGSLDTVPKAEGGIALSAPGVVLIDELDAHLHVTWQRNIGDWMRQHFPNIQFIVSSHSPYICQAADPGGLIRMPGPDEDRPPEVVTQDLYQRIVYGSGDDAALSELFGLETPYSDRAQGKRQRLVALERRIYAETATEAEAAEYAELSALLSSSLETRVTEVAARLGGDG